MIDKILQKYNISTDIKYVLYAVIIWIVVFGFIILIK